MVNKLVDAARQVASLIRHGFTTEEWEQAQRQSRGGGRVAKKLKNKRAMVKASRKGNRK